MAIRNGEWLEARDISEQVEEGNAAWRAEIASQRAADAHLIIDDRPGPGEL